MAGSSPAMTGYIQSTLAVMTGLDPVIHAVGALPAGDLIALRGTPQPAEHHGADGRIKSGHDGLLCR